MDMEAIKIALGIEPQIVKKEKKYSFIKYPIFNAGSKVLKILPIDDIFSNPEVVFIHFYIKEGDVIKTVTQSAEKPVFIIVKSIDRNSLFNKMNIIEKQIREKIILN